MKYVKWFLCFAVVLFAGYGVKSFFFPKKPGHHVDHGFVKEGMPDTILNPNAEEGGPSALFSEVKFGESSTDATSSVLFNGAEATSYTPMGSPPPVQAALPAPPFGSSAQALPAPAFASQYETTEAPAFEANSGADALPPSPFGSPTPAPALQEAPTFPAPPPMSELPAVQTVPTASTNSWDSPAATPVSPAPLASQETPRPFEGGPIGQNSVTAEPVGQEAMTPQSLERQAWDGPSSPLPQVIPETIVTPTVAPTTSRAEKPVSPNAAPPVAPSPVGTPVAVLPPAVLPPPAVVPARSPEPVGNTQPAPKVLKPLPPVTEEGPSLTYRTTNPIRTEAAANLPIPVAEPLRQEREIDHILLSRATLDAPVTPPAASKPRQPTPSVALVEFRTDSATSSASNQDMAQPNAAEPLKSELKLLETSPAPEILADVPTTPEIPPMSATPVFPPPISGPLPPSNSTQSAPGVEFMEPRHLAETEAASVVEPETSLTSGSDQVSVPMDLAHGLSETLPKTPPVSAPTANAMPQSPPNLRESVVRYVQNQCSLIDSGTNQAICEGFDWLSQLYEHKDLNTDERAYMAPILDQLAHDVIFSPVHVLEPPYQVKAFDTIETVARQYDLNPETLMRINGMTQPGPLTPGSTLKVVQGPFDLRISLQRNELQIILGGLYAGSCQVAVSDALRDQEGEYLVQEKRVVGVDNHARWIGLGGGKGITTASKLDQPNPNPLVLVPPAEMLDLFDLLGEKSTITIVK